MNKGQKRSALSYIPGLANNAVLKLIIFSATAYMILAITWAITMIVYQGDTRIFATYFIPNLALPSSLGVFKGHWWTIVTYGLFHYQNSFMELLSNMLWLYCFGSVVQMLVGHRQVIPLYLYCLLTGGAFYLIGQLFPGSWGACPPYILGPRAGLIGMAAAAITLTPKYRFYLTERFSIPLALVAGIFAVLMVFSSGFYLPVIFMLAGGGIMGFAYVKLLHAGYRPGQWIYVLFGKIESLVTPNENMLRQKNSSRRNEVLNRIYEPKNGVSQKHIDAILDKINQKGYNSLTADEKRALMQAGKE